ncbi:hypothetical protein [Geopseudomonas aromaticivorans]
MNTVPSVRKIELSRENFCSGEPKLINFSTCRSSLEGCGRINQHFLNCGSDMRCLQQEGVVIQQKYKALTQSGAWISNNCTVVMQVEQKASQAARSGGSNVYMVESDHNDEIFMAVAEAECNTVTGLKQVHHAATPLSGYSKLIAHSDP